MNRATLACAAIVLAAFFAPSWGAGRATAVAATPTPAALQYDEISRFVLPPATPPPPGSFVADYQTIVGSASASPAPQHGLGSLLGSMLGPNASGAIDSAMSAMREGHLTRYTYYRGWIRTDDPVAQTATISKCDQHQFIALNLAKKTYTVTNTQPACPTPMMPASRPQPETPQTPAPPGTVDMTVKSTSQNLGPLAIDNVATTGSAGSVSMSMTNATGSCHDGAMQMNLTQYVSTIAVPRAYCPLPHMASSPEEIVRGRSPGGGCRPTMHLQGSGSAIGWSENTLGRLVIYQRASMGAGNPDQQDRTAGMAMVTQRGNVTWLSGAPAEALFTIPPGFTQSG